MSWKVWVRILSILNIRPCLPNPHSFSQKKIYDINVPSKQLLLSNVYFSRTICLLWMVNEFFRTRNTSSVQGRKILFVPKRGNAHIIESYTAKVDSVTSKTFHPHFLMSLKDWSCHRHPKISQISSSYSSFYEMSMKGRILWRTDVTEMRQKMRRAESETPEMRQETLNASQNDWRARSRDQSIDIEIFGPDFLMIKNIP